MRNLFFLSVLLLLLQSCSTTSHVQSTPPHTTVVDVPVSIGVESSAIVKPHQIFGANGQINFNRDGFDDSSVMRAGDSLHLDAIRYPGGTISQKFRWLTDTPSLPSLAGFVSYCKIPVTFIVLNMTTSTLEEQLKMLAMARSLHIFVDSPYLELNNEFEAVHDDNFLNKCAVWYNALKSQYPGAQIGIPGGSPSKWNQKVLARLPNVFLVDHYHNPRNYTRNGMTDTLAIDSMMRADKRRYFPGIPGSRLWVTEFNLQLDDNTTPAFANDEQKALAVEYMFRWFQRHGFAVALLHNFCMASGNGMIVSEGPGSHVSPTGDGFIKFKQSLNQ